MENLPYAGHPRSPKSAGEDTKSVFWIAKLFADIP